MNNSSQGEFIKNVKDTTFPDRCVYYNTVSFLPPELSPKEIIVELQFQIIFDRSI